ncbi:MAG TPA: LuxR C-terminal-related transcriptional regulator [Caulobacter sp.]|nr:LuxR C-terminal-related transcriptional regulator [Caulobacter sp.]
MGLIKMIEVVDSEVERGVFEAHVANAILNLVNFGVIVADSEGCVYAANELAWSYVQHGDGLGEKGGLLNAENDFEAEGLRSRIASAVRQGRPGAMLVHRSRSQKPLVLLIEPFSTDDSNFRCALITVREVGRSSAHAVERARMMFNFSPAEAEIVSRVAQGREPAEIAAERGVSINTLRVQMASAMVKVGVHRQAELVSVLSSADVLE